MKLAKSLLVASAMTGLLTTASLADAAQVAKGKEIFNNKKKGNCFACHNISGQKIDGPGSFGPDLSTTAYYPTDMLYNLVYDMYKVEGKPKVSAMPPFGRNGWLSDTEIKAVVAYLQSHK